MTKEQKISTLVLVIVIGFVTAVIFHYFQGVYAEKDYPYNTFLFRPDDRFMDFFNPLRGSYDRDPYNPARIHFIGGYLPFGYFVSFLFSLIYPWQFSIFVFLICLISFLVWYITDSLYGHKRLLSNERLNIFALSLMTYPVLFILDRVNFDGLVLIFLALFTYFYQRGRQTLATLLLTIPIAMKGYPLIFMAIPLLDKRFRDIFVTAILVSVLEIASLAFFKDGLITEFGKMMTSFGTAYSIAFESGSLVRFNSSLYTFLIFLNPTLVTLKWFSRVYTLTLLVIFAIIMVVMYFKKYPFWKKLLLLTLMMILFPQSSADYRLLLLYPALMTFIAVREPYNTDRTMILLFGALLIPKAYLILQADVNFGILLNPILLAILLIITVIPSQPSKTLLAQPE